MTEFVEGLVICVGEGAVWQKDELRKDTRFSLKQDGGGRQRGALMKWKLLGKE